VLALNKPKGGGLKRKRFEELSEPGKKTRIWREQHPVEYALGNKKSIEKLKAKRDQIKKEKEKKEEEEENDDNYNDPLYQTPQQEEEEQEEEEEIPGYCSLCEEDFECSCNH